MAVAAPALLFIAVEIAFSMNCPSGFWLEVEIEWLRLVCVDRRHCGRQEQRCGEGLVELTQNAGVGDAHDRRARGHRVGRAPGAGVR